MVFALSVKRQGAANSHAVQKLAERVDPLGSSQAQVTMRSDGEPAVMQVAAAVRDARRAGSVTTLETSARSDPAGNGLAERALGLIGFHVHKNELEFNCHDAEPGHRWVRWKGTGRMVARSRTPHVQIVFVERCSCNLAQGMVAVEARVHVAERLATRTLPWSGANDHEEVQRLQNTYQSTMLLLQNFQRGGPEKLKGADDPRHALKGDGDMLGHPALLFASLRHIKKGAERNRQKTEVIYYVSDLDNTPSLTGKSVKSAL